MKPILKALPLTMALGLSGFAQPADEPPGWSAEVGAGLITSPAFAGADEQHVMLVPDVRVRYGDGFSASVARGARYVVWKKDGVQVGPLARIDFGRDEGGDSPFRIVGDDPVALKGLHEVDATVLAGAFLTYRKDDWTVEAELLRGLGSHEGLVMLLALDYAIKIAAPEDRGPPWMIATGPWLRWVNADYNNAYFGLTAADALASGLPRYEAGGGANAGWAARLVRPLNRRAAVVAFLVYERLLGDAADSPLVTQHGNPNQVSAGLFVSFKL